MLTGDGERPAHGRRRRLLGRLAAVAIGLAGWTGIAAMGRTMLAHDPPQAGFDLELMLGAGRRVADGLTPYDPSAVGGTVQAHDLFFSYPPFVAQVLSPIASLPTWVVLTVWDVAAVAGLGLAVALVWRAFAPRDGGISMVDAALLSLAAAPFLLPLTVGLLFGNVDVWWPLLFAPLVVLAAGSGREPVAGAERGFAAGAGLGLAVAVKLHPGSLLAWLVARWWRDRASGLAARRWLTAALVAVIVGALLVALSVAVGGLGPWADYVARLRTASGADIASRLNAGPASQLALLAGTAGAAEVLGMAVTAAALVATVLAARWLDDPLESVAIGIAASLAVLPITWYHYPVALVPVAVAALARCRADRRVIVGAWLVAALGVADVAVLLPAGIWLAVVLVIVAAHSSRPAVGVAGRALAAPAGGG